ncbi:hypothetical protein ARMSODRAFT_980026 [Armillaria solidipes]|uniref:Uncharacterized protein n=1 Tax=Armillaria solidipes TaxID=1076256 RepID=A0A2H3B0X1_9AGAR|nr:hypothetical protein ARMSODRAFT_980026 [Armillaria solidipes]
MLVVIVLHRDISTKTTTVVVAVGFIMETQYPSSSRLQRSQTRTRAAGYGDMAELKQLEVDEGRFLTSRWQQPYRQHHDTNPANKALHTNVDTITVSDLTQLGVIHSTYPAHKVAEHYTASEKHFLRGDIYVWDSSIMAAIASGCRPGGPARSN